MKEARVNSVILCEQIRQEIGHKFNLVGVFGPRILINTIPGAFPLSIYAEVENLVIGEHVGELRCIGPRKQVMFSVEIIFSAPEIEVIAMALGPSPMVVTIAGDYKIEWRLGESKFETMKKFTINLDESISER